MLDDVNVIKQRDPQDALAVAGEQYSQAAFEAEVYNPENDEREIQQVIVAGMGGSALAAKFVKSWLARELTIPFEVVSDYDLPHSVNSNSLVIASSYSGNTEETLTCLWQARQVGAQVAVIASGGKLVDAAQSGHIAYSTMPAGIQPRMAMLLNLRALLKLLVHFSVVEPKFYDEVAEASEWLRAESDAWHVNQSTDRNLAKQLALLSVGKTPVIYGSNLLFPIAYKWKISWNENAKNVAFCNAYPEFNHNEFMGWVSHPIEKPFVIFDLISPEFDNPRILQRFTTSDRLLSGLRPKSNVVKLSGDSPLRQMLWGCVLADFVSIYVAILNGVDPTPVVLIEKLKQELAN